MSSLSRRQVVRACKRRGWTVQPAALKGILEMSAQEFQGEEEEVIEYILGVVSQYMKGKVLTKEVWDDAAANSSLAEDPKGYAPNPTASERQSDIHQSERDDIEVIGAFDTPKLTYESMRKQFKVEEKSGSLFGSADDKVCRRWCR